MATKNSAEEKLVTAALLAIEKSGWASLSLLALARKAKIAPEILYDLCPDKRTLLSLIAKRVDTAFLESAPEPDESATMRDRAFDAILNWFEKIEPMRPALAVMRSESGGDLGIFVDLVPATMRSAHWIAESGALPTTGWQGFLVTRGLGLLLADTMGAWLGDGPDLSKTMAHVDRRLRTFEEWAETFRRMRTARDSDDGADHKD